MAQKDKKLCGIIMPISECDGKPPSHWVDVLNILEGAANTAGFDARLVSETFESNLIHKEILQNIYHDDIIICDVSGRNPNVFFELGIRMATQMPTVIVKDDKTLYPFDTSPTRYLEYPRDLRHPLMEKFKSDLESALKRVIQHDKKNSFIGQLGPFQIPDVESTTLPASDIILERLERMERRLLSIRNSEIAPGIYGINTRERSIKILNVSDTEIFMEVRNYDDTKIENGISDFVGRFDGKVKKVTRGIGPNHNILTISGKNLDYGVAESAAQIIEDAIPF